MIKKILLRLFSLLVLVGITLPSWGQRENTNWYFGANAAVNFPTSGVPTAVSGSVMNTSEACASVSDAAGQLLFYTNSETIWTKTNQVMASGTNQGGHNSCSQGALVVQNPANNQQYYVFILDAAENFLAGGLKYSLVDMTRQGGLGEVIQSRVQVSSVRLTEKITAVPHSNGRDTWILVHGWQTNTFYAYLLTPNGLQTNPVTTNIGAIHSGGGGANANANSVGYIRVSSDRRKLALGIRDYGFELFDFDPMTGILANYIPLQTVYRSYGVEFSLDNRLLYGTDLDGQSIFQYDLQAGSASDIASSGQVIATTSKNVGAVQAGPDGKLYVSVVGSSYLSVIENPSVRGAGCNFRENGVYLNGKTARTGLPNFYAIRAAPINYVASFSFTPSCAGAITSFAGAVQPSASGVVATWNFGDPTSGSSNMATGLTPTHTYAAAGTYLVTMSAVVPGVTNPLVVTQVVTVLPLPQVNLGSDVVVCANQFLLSAGVQPAGSTYRWQDGSSNDSYLAQTSGRYSVTVTSAAGCASTAAVNVTLNAPPTVRLPLDTLVCGTSVLLRPRVQTSGNSYRWQDGSTGATYLAQASGRYSVTVTSAAGCASTAAVNVALTSVPVVRLPADTATCSTSVALRPGPQPAGSTYRWQDGSTGATYLAQASGRYSVTVTSAAGCASTAAVNVTLNAPPIVRLPLDTLVCGSSMLLRPRVQLAGSIYRWQDGSTGSTYLAQASGRYSVTVTSPVGCSSTAAVNVVLNSIPVVRLPADTTACGASVVLRPSVQPAGSTYRWQDGSTGATYLARASGRYSVIVTTAQGCASTAAVNVTLNAVPRPRLPLDTLVCAASVLLQPGVQPAGSTYRWQDGSTSATYLAQASGTYTVLVTTPQGCASTATSQVRLGTKPSVSLGADTTICSNATVLLRATSQPAGTLYRWQDGSTAATYLAHGPGQYSVEVRATASSCPAIATRTVTVADCPITIPNIITPNGDRENEFFILKGLVAAEWHLIIFDRWGRQVYDRAHYDNGWNALGQASGMYYYLLTNETTGGRYRGWVEVIRGN